MADCFDRDGERSKLKAAIAPSMGVSLVTGRSGVGKSTVIEAALDEQQQHQSVIKYEYGRNPLGLIDYLTACVHSAKPARSAISASLRSISIGEITIKIPFLGSAPIKIGSAPSSDSSMKLRIADLSIAVQGPFFLEHRKRIQKLVKLFDRADFKIIWIANAELCDPIELGVILLLISQLAPSLHIILEGAFPSTTELEITDIVSQTCLEQTIPFNKHQISSFSQIFARQFYEYLNLDNMGVAFSFLRNAGNPAAIKFDLEIDTTSSSVSSAIQMVFDANDESLNTAIFLTLFYSVERNYDNLVRLADGFDVRLEFDPLLSVNLLTLTHETCEFSHPRVPQFISIVKRQDLHRMVRQFWMKRTDATPQFYLAALSHASALDPQDREALFEDGLEYALSALEDNRFGDCDTTLSLIGNGLLGFESELTDTILKLKRRHALLQTQLDVLLCRWSGTIGEPSASGALEMLFASQVRMRQIDLEGAIALSLGAEHTISLEHPGTAVSPWLLFCCRYIRASCYIAQGNFEAFEQERASLSEKADQLPQYSGALVSLLPKGASRTETIVSSSTWSPTEDTPAYLAARYANNRACALMFDNVKEASIGEMLERAARLVAKEGSIEITFPMNNLGLFKLYSGDVDDAIDLYYDMISYCVYPYDYFCAYNNLAIGLAANGHIQPARTYFEQAEEVLANNNVLDPVFRIKSAFNVACIRRCDGDAESWASLEEDQFDFARMPLRYRSLFRAKRAKVENSAPSPRNLCQFHSQNIETSTLLWPQNLCFWDFMYPIISRNNFDDLVELVPQTIS